ncbi:MAG: hypothetical protein KIS86_06960 [Devosia sp.]|nr:hypothetical protein [Devosia sp.]
MTLPFRHALLGSTLAVACLLAAAPASLADGIDPDRLVRFGERDYIVDYEDWVSTDPISTQIVTKIEAGKVSRVSITRTSTGTYSTDALTSRHVQYPGISVRPVTDSGFSFASWSNGIWTSFDTYGGNSFVSVATSRTHQGQPRATTCISTASFWYC